MISPTSNPELFVGTTSTTTRSPKQTLDKDAFLQLLVTQLKNQDPSNTMDTYQLSSQLAQFASVEQLNNLNTLMLQQAQASQLGTLVGQTAFSASLVGRDVVVVGDQVEVPTSGRAQVHIEVGGSGGTATLQLLDDTGAVVETRSLGRLAAGTQNVSLPGDLPSGNWHYKIDVQDANQQPVDVTTFTTGTVTHVQFKNGRILLVLGSIEVSLDDLVEISAGGEGGSDPSGGPRSATPPAPIEDPYDPITLLRARRN